MSKQINIVSIAIINSPISVGRYLLLLLDTILYACRFMLITIRFYGFIKNEDEPCVYKKVSGSQLTFLVLYVDDILLIGNDVSMKSFVKIWLIKTFSIKDLGEATYILKIQVYRDRLKRIIGLSQSFYLERVLKRFNMLDSKRGLLSFRHSIDLSKMISPKLLRKWSIWYCLCC